MTKQYMQLWQEAKQCPWGIDVALSAMEHAREEYPKEACGVVVGYRYIRQRNIANDPLKEFKIDPRVTTPLLDCKRLQAVLHSHPDGPDHPTAADMESQFAMRVPFGVVPVYKEAVQEPIWWGDQLPIRPLVGRKFVHGVFDCGSALRDWFRKEKKIILPDYARDHAWWNNADSKVGMYMERYEEAGFERLHGSEELRIGDVFVMTIGRSPVPCHSAVYIGNGLMYHHMMFTLSRNDLAARYKEQINARIRHKDMR
jgi:proteasome lid subunit RPN8/RPN11